MVNHHLSPPFGRMCLTFSNHLTQIQVFIGHIRCSLKFFRVNQQYIGVYNQQFQRTIRLQWFSMFS